MHHQALFPSKPSTHYPQHPLLSNQLQPINSDSHTSMWLDDSYSVSTVCPSQRDSGFNSRPASLRSIESIGTGPVHHGVTPENESIPPPPSSYYVDNTHSQYANMQPAPSPSTAVSAQIIPELLNLLMEDDPVIVREAVILTHMLIREGGETRSEVIQNRQVRRRKKRIILFNKITRKLYYFS